MIRKTRQTNSRLRDNQPLSQRHIEKRRRFQLAAKSRKRAYRLGFQTGIRLGRREAVLRGIRRSDIETWNIKILYVEEGLFNVNQGIMDALRDTVKELIVAGAYDEIIPLAQKERPDLILVLNGVHGFDVSQLNTLRSLGFKTAVWFADDPYFTDKTKKYALLYDYVFTHEQAAVPYYMSIGCEKVFYLPLAANPAIFQPRQVDATYHSDICFIGTGFSNRISLFNHIIPYLPDKKIFLAGALWNSLHDYSSLKKNIRLHGVSPEESVRYYNGAKIVINLHRDPYGGLNSDGVPGHSINPRTYEIAASGGFQLTDIRNDLSQLYTPGFDIETFSSAMDLVNKIKYYLNHEREREQIALRSLKTTFEQHTYVTRISSLLRAIFGSGEKFGTGSFSMLTSIKTSDTEKQTVATVSLLGWRKGYQQGWDGGYILGRSEAINRQNPTPSPSRRSLRIIYVTSGLGIPYNPIDSFIIDALQEQVAELLIRRPNENIAETASIIRPDLVLVFNGMKFPVREADAIRAKGIRTAIWMTDDPYYTDETIGIARHYDFVFTLELNCVDFYRKHGSRNVYYLPLAADTRVFNPRCVTPSFRKEISFIGTAYWKRVKFFEPIIPFLASRDTHINGWWWDRLSNYHLIAKKIALNDWVSPGKTASYYAGSKIVINLHRSVDEDSWNANRMYRIPALSINPRTYEVNACATLQLTDERSELKNMYIPGKEIETYSSAQELVEKVNYYLEHENERRTIAWNGYRRTLQDHTYSKRIFQMLTLLFGAV